MELLNRCVNLHQCTKDPIEKVDEGMKVLQLRKWSNSVNVLKVMSVIMAHESGRAD